MPMRGKAIVNAADMRTLMSRDKVIDEIHRQYGIPPDWRNDEGFISLSKTILAGDLRSDELAGKRENTIRQKLTAIKGIGDWTANIYLMFCLQFKDVFPQGDIAVINIIKELYDADNTEDAIKISERWKPLRSLGSYFMWHHYLKKRRRDSLF